MNILEPIAFPNAKSPSFFKAAIMHVTISGKDVPKDTIVIAITLSLTPKNSAIDTAPSTTKSAPYFKPITPNY